MTEAIVVCGPLGSGKTTTINKLIGSLRGSEQRLYGIINDIGVLNVDSTRVDLTPDKIRGYSSGCVCCERREDLERALDTLDTNNVDKLIVEPSGAANPIDIVDSLLGYQNIELKHVLALVPVGHLSSVRSKRSFRDGLAIANAIGYTWVDRGLDQVREFLDSQGATDQRVLVDGDFGYSQLDQMAAWAEVDGLERHSHGHEHYHTTVKPINTSATRDDVIRVLNLLATRGITRAKGTMPSQGISFDIVGNQLSISEGRQKGSLGYIVLIDEGDLPVSILEPITCVRPEGEFFSSDSTREERLSTFHFYFDMSSRTNFDLGGVVQTNFEAPDEAYTAAKKIALQDGDFNPLRLALVPYIDIRLRSLRLLETKCQGNRNYVGVMLGSFTIQMFGSWDGIPFHELADYRQLEKIRREAVPAYFSHLRSFGDVDLDPIRGIDGDSYSRYFVKMAVQAKPYADAEGVRTAVLNMESVYRRSGKQEIADLWRGLYAA